MALVDKIIAALQVGLGAEYVRLDDDDGISGFVVSPRFRGISSLDRQDLIDRALRKSENPLSKEEQRKILMIAGLTPAEYESVGARIVVPKIVEADDGWLEVSVLGGSSDANYVRAALSRKNGVTVTEPERSSHPGGTLTTFRAQGTGGDSLTRERAIDLLGKDPYIFVEG